jgi:hypothetical protein
MSQYVTKLSSRDGINWPTPAGTWQQNEEVNRLEMFANNLDVSHAPGDTDLLNSVPTPWARLLLFESALYKPTHPSHADVQDQWRGLLGVLALAEPLKLSLAVNPFRLSDPSHQASPIGRSFATLRPTYFVDGRDEEADKWNDFQTISVDGTVVGATSPRTLIFTGIAHRCPTSVPFRTTTGRLTDPAAYYRRFGDSYFLSILAHWIQGLVNTLQADNELAAWMGTVPAARGAGAAPRIRMLLERLRAWQNSPELQGVQPRPVDGQPVQRFALEYYKSVYGLPPIQLPGTSDLFLRGSRDVLVCYSDPTGNDPGARLLTASGQEVMNERIKIYDGRWVYSTQPLPLPFTGFLPPQVKVIEDPVALFEDALIKVNLPPQADSVYALRIGNEQASQTYLYPFKQEILRYLTPKQIAENTTVSINKGTNKPRVELEIPLENNRKIRVAREYDADAGAVIADPSIQTAWLSAWPDFASPGWRRYYYVKRTFQQTFVDFEPTAPVDATRSKGDKVWYSSSKPAEAFVGSVNSKRGLLLLRHRALPAADKFWKIGIDFGSTHTRAYALEVDFRDEKYVPAPNSNIEAVPFATRATALTDVQTYSLQNAFFAISGELDPPQREELKTLLMMPETNPGELDGWLPREGYVYTHWIYGGDYDATHLRYNLKWNNNREDPDLRAYLRCLLIMIQAEAAERGARVVSISHTYPSVFTNGLKAKHKAGWRGLQQYINRDVPESEHLKVEDATITETVAVCRHLEVEQDASPVDNTISLDVGGSTTDMAVWAKRELKVQESIKMAAGIVGNYLQSPGAHDFLVWLEKTLQSSPFNVKDFKLSNFKDKPAGYSLMFNNLLSVVEWKRQRDVLIELINGAGESRSLRAHIIYLYGALLYYAGLLARKEGLPKEQDSYKLHFCGKGGTLIEWIPGYRQLAREMFTAGLFGPAGPGQNKLPTVDSQVSRWPKEEVGRGLLAKSRLEGIQREEVGLVDSKQPTVTVAETGYRGLNWNGVLDASALLQLPDNTTPPMDKLEELRAFRRAFATAETTKATSAELGLDGVTDAQFQTRLRQRLFGAAEGSIVSDVKERPEDALLEPLFITEVKVLIEAATSNPKLFS